MTGARLPNIDLHRHLDGNVRLQTILDLAREHGVALPGTTLETLRPHVQVDGVMPDLVSWLDKLRWMTAVLADVDACRRIARENVEDAQRDGLDYVELRFSPYFMAQPHGLDPAAVVEAVVAGIEEGRTRTGIGVNLIGILSRTYGPEACAIELDALLTQQDRIVALDLAGDELGWPAELFATHFRRARDAGWSITVHAGEAGDAQSIWSAIRALGATRIGHGTHAIDDPALMDYLAEHRIGLEVNLTSNVQTNTVASYREHPMKRFLAHGIPATLNTDDPVVSGIDWPHEIRVAAPAAGLTEDEIRQAQRNAVDVAFLSPSEKDALLAP
ncbi:MAG TPA: adenosine deaminase [Candidatus Limnocylindria bacterium]|jgi:adenosine deaminase|nr:adenosine deaminase [Candidatus Limnocylindria bacterium]